MEQKRDTAIILRTVPFEERHRIVTALTENHGLVTAMAKNCISSRRFGGSLDCFVASEWLFTQKPGAEMIYLQEAVAKRSFEGLRKEFERLSLASVFNELMIKLAPKLEPCEELFRLHANALATLEELPDSSDADLKLLNAYLAKVLQWSGSQPQLHACLGCGTTAEAVAPDAALNCVVVDAGWLCPSCRHTETHHVRERGGQNFGTAMLRVTPGAIQDFYISLTVPIRQVPSRCRASWREHQELFKFLEALFVYHIPGFDQQPLKGLRFLELESTVRPQPMSRR